MGFRGFLHQPVTSFFSALYVLPWSGLVRSVSVRFGSVWFGLVWPLLFFCHLITKCCVFYDALVSEVLSRERSHGTWLSKVRFAAGLFLCGRRVEKKEAEWPVVFKPSDCERLADKVQGTIRARNPGICVLCAALKEHWGRPCTRLWWHALLRIVAGVCVQACTVAIRRLTQRNT